MPPLRVDPRREREGGPDRRAAASAHRDRSRGAHRTTTSGHPAADPEADAPVVSSRRRSRTRRGGRPRGRRRLVRLRRPIGTEALRLEPARGDALLDFAFAARSAATSSRSLYERFWMTALPVSKNTFSVMSILPLWTLICARAGGQPCSAGTPASCGHSSSSSGTPSPSASGARQPLYFASPFTSGQASSWSAMRSPSVSFAGQPPVAAIPSPSTPVVGVRDPVAVVVEGGALGRRVRLARRTGVRRCRRGRRSGDLAAAVGVGEARRVAGQTVLREGRLRGRLGRGRLLRSSTARECSEQDDAGSHPPRGLRSPRVAGRHTRGVHPLPSHTGGQ